MAVRDCQTHHRISPGWAKVALALATLLLGVQLAVAVPNGAKMYRGLEESGGLYDNAEWQNYVQAIGDRLLYHEYGEDHPQMVFTVVDSSDVNAFAMDGGYIFIHRGLIAHLRSEDELAGVIGHEIGHIVGRHLARRNLPARVGRTLGWIGAILTGSGEVLELANLATQELVSGYGREYELEADAYGGQFVAKAGYNPHAMIETIQVLKDNQLFQTDVRGANQSYHGLFTSHPRNDKRLHDAVQRSMHLVTEEMREPVGDFWALLDGLVFGDQAAGGVLRDSTYYHGSFRFVVTFPERFAVRNTPAAVIAVDPAQQGTQISLQRNAAPTEDQSPAEYVEKTLKRDDVKDGSEFTIGSFPAYAGEIEVLDGKSAARMIGVVYKGNAVFLFKGDAGSGADPEQFKKDFLATMASFRAMNADDVKLANNQRIKVIEAAPGDTYAKLAARSSLTSHGEETLRLINGHHPNGEPRAGDLIKIVQ